MILILSTSLNAESNSRLLAETAATVLRESGTETGWIDLRDFPLPLCDGGAAYSHPHVAALRAQIADAAAILVGTPIYNYDGGAAFKNLLELTGRAWENKVVAFLCAAGGQSSYMSIMALANSLMLDFRCVIVPRFVYATGEDFSNGRLTSAEQLRRVRELAESAARLARAVQSAA